jgi:agmatinase
MTCFGGLPPFYSDKDTAKIVVVPVPYDGTSTWIRGSAGGPTALIDASANMELYDIETDTEVYKQGIFTDVPVKGFENPGLMVHMTRQRITDWLEKGKYVVTLGGEHSVSLGAIQAHKDRYPGMCVLQLDAHTDLRQEYEGSRFNHACVMARVRELMPLTQAGIRSMDIEEKEFIVPGRVFYMEKMITNQSWVQQVIDTLARDVYLTFDLDVLDPSIMPSTGTPEPGGMDWYTAISLIRQVVLQRNLVGFDIVELCPEKHNKAPDFLAAKLLYKTLSYIYNK